MPDMADKLRWLGKAICNRRRALSKRLQRLVCRMRRPLARLLSTSTRTHSWKKTLNTVVHWCALLTRPAEIGKAKPDFPILANLGFAEVS